MTNLSPSRLTVLSGSISGIRSLRPKALKTLEEDFGTGPAYLATRPRLDGKELQMSRRMQKKAILWTFIGLVLSLGVVHNATSATYNFYFNNVEQQGEGSTATPTVTITEDDLKKKTVATEETEETEKSPEIVETDSEPTPAVGTSEATNRVSASKRSMVGGTGSTRLITSLYGFTRLDEVDDFWDESPSTTGGFSVEAGWGRSNLGVNVLLGAHEARGEDMETMLGAEAELFLIRNSQFALGLMGGGTYLSDSRELYPHLGGRVSISLFPDMGLSASVRRSSEFSVVQAGLVFRL